MSIIKSEKGFTLLEMAIGMLILGLIMAPALSAYNLYEKDRKLRQTGIALTSAGTAISGFRESYGRLPCPAPLDAAPGDADYGYEDCTATAPGVVTANNGGGTPDVYIGALPFRTMNLQERETTDGYDNRLTYAVTADLTDTTTYAPNGGGIEITDKNGNSVITGSGVSGGAHFIVISHGQYGAGAYSYFGTLNQTCADAPADDQENCDHTAASPDATFISSNLSDDSDDRVMYTALNDVTPWQYQDGNTRNIHLRVADFAILGKDNPSADPEIAPGVTPQALEVRDRSAGSVEGDGDLYVENGAIMTDVICDNSGTNCFNPNLIGGVLSGALSTPQIGTPLGPLSSYGYTTSTGGLTCDDGSGTRRVMVGIDDSRPVCSSVLQFRCPDGLEMSSISGGNMVCSDPGTACTADEPAVTMCGDNVTITDDRLDGQYVQVYSGECFFAEPWNPTPADLASPATIQAYVDTLNNTPRTQGSCGAGSTYQLIRESFQCRDGSYIRASDPGGIARSEYRQEKISPGSWPGSISTNSGGRHAENTMGSYNVGMVNNPTSANYGDHDRHDCWCKEEYRMDLGGCGPNLNGNTVTVRKHTCPATRQRWLPVYTNSTSFCSCSTANFQQDDDCFAHFGVGEWQVDGTVRNDYETSCSPPDTYITNSVFSCTCPSNAPQFRYTPCPSGTTNSFNYNSTPYTGIDLIEMRQWVCPTGMGGAVTDASEVGNWGPYVPVSDEACTCDNSAMGSEHEPCGPYEDGPGITYQTQLNCATGLYERTGVELGGYCNECSWKKPGTGNTESAPRGVPTTNACSCGEVSACRESLGGGLYLVWDGCQCTTD